MQGMTKRERQVTDEAQIRQILAEMPSAAQIRQMLALVGMDMQDFYGLYREKLQDAILYAKDLKDRYSVLWIYYLLKKGAVK